MWRRLLRRCHPDAGGDHDLFVWARNLQEHVERVRVLSPADVLRQPPKHAGNGHRAERIPFDPDPALDLQRRAMSMADDGTVEPMYARLLLLLSDYAPTGEDTEEIGASYPLLAAIGHRAEFDKMERSGWYEVCRAVPLSQAHAAHIIGRLKVGGWAA